MSYYTKTASGTGTLTGNGTANTVAKWTGATALGNSLTTDDGTVVTVNTASTFRSVAAANGSTSFFAVTGTTAASPAGAIGANISITEGGANSGSTDGFRTTLTTLNPTASSQHFAIRGVGAGAGPIGDVLASSSSLVGVLGISGSTSTGGPTTSYTGMLGVVDAAGRIGYGVIGYQAQPGPSKGAGVYAASNGSAANAVALLAQLGSTEVTSLTSRETAILATNGTVVAPVAVFADNFAALPSTGATATSAILDGGVIQAGNSVLTNGTMTAENQGLVTSVVSSYVWTTAMVNTALGAGTTGDITVATLPAKTVVKNAYIVITEAAAGPATLTVALGRTAATYLDYIAASDAKAAANTVYGDASGERGANLTGYDLPSYTGTTDVKCHFIAGDTTDLTLGQGRVILETALVP